MTWILALFTAITANLDNLGVGIAYGVRNIKVSWQANLIIAFLSFGATFFAEKIGELIKAHIALAVANLFGAALIVFVGVWVLIGASGIKESKDFKKSRWPQAIIGRPEQADHDESHHIDWREAFVLGFALSINTLAIGIDVSMTDLPSLLMPLLVGLCSFITLWIGAYVGKKYGAEWLGQKATLLSGFLLICLGLRQLF